MAKRAPACRFCVLPPPAHASRVLSVHCDAKHRFSKPAVLSMEVEAGHGVVGDAHYGATVQHRYDKRWRPQAPNLRQVHLISMSLLHMLGQQGFAIRPGELGENICLDDAPDWHWDALLRWPLGTELHFAQGPVLALTGWRQPCVWVDRFACGLRAAMELPASTHDAAEALPYRTGVMAVVRTGGHIQPGDTVRAQPPATPWQPMHCV